jgi:hypothetical protein
MFLTVLGDTAIYHPGLDLCNMAFLHMDSLSIGVDGKRREE